MRAFNVLVLGQTGSGKTTFVKEKLLPRAPRYVIFDKFLDYSDCGEVFESFDEATNYIREYLEHDFRVVFQGENDTAYHALFHFMLKAQKWYDLPPVLLVLEEASEYSDSYSVYPEIEYAYKYARRWGIYMIAISQRDVQIHPVMRDNSQAYVIFSQKKISADYRPIFGERLNELPHLSPIGPPDWEPREDENYIVHPKGMDVGAELESVLTETGDSD